MDLINISLAFLEGFALIISPCILPILPIILSGSLTGTKQRPLGIIVGFIVIFSIVLLFSRAIIQMLHVDPDILRTAAFVILILLGIVMMSSYLSEKFNLATQRLVNVGGSIQTINNQESGFWGGFLFGGLVGVIWTPCAGPILAAIIVQVALQQETITGLFAVFAFAVGAGLPMLLIAWLGRSMMSRFHFFRDHANLCRKILGAIIIISVIYVMVGLNPSLSVAEAKQQKLNSSSLMNGLYSPYPAPQIDGISAWINSPALTISELKGKVVLIDFWTYSCINCIRTLPILKDWYAKYHDKGFEIVGIHTPEFEFEKDLTNVKNAVTKFGILYPVALDNQYVTWRNYQNSYWPAHYLINKNGEVVYTHFGEGEYDVTENNIRYLLGLSGQLAQQYNEETGMPYGTPETYLGFARAENFSNTQVMLKNKISDYHYPQVLPSNAWALKGKWMINADRIVSASTNASIKLHFNAGKVFAVMGVTGLPVSVKLFLNGELLIENKGKDVAHSEIKVTQHQLYSIIQLKQPGEGILEIVSTSPGLEIYTFTFGS